MLRWRKLGARHVTAVVLCAIGLTVVGGSGERPVPLGTSQFIAAGGEEPTPKPDLTAESALASEPIDRPFRTNVAAGTPVDVPASVAYAVMGDEVSTIYRLDPDGTILEVARSSERVFTSLAGAPTDSRAAVVSATQTPGDGGGEDGTSRGQRFSVSILDLSTGVEVMLIDNASSSRPVWSDDGTAVAVTVFQPDGSADAVTVDLSTGSQQTVIDASSYPFAPDWGCSTRAPAVAAITDWSPDGRQIIGTVSVHCHEVTFDDLVLATTGEEKSAQQLADRGVHNVAGTFSPDGGHVAFASDATIYGVSVHDGAVTRLVDGSDPAWSPEGNLAAVSPTSGRDLATADLTVRSASGEERRVDLEVPISTPRWSPEHHLLLLAPASDTRGLFLLPDGSGEPQLLVADVEFPVLDATFVGGVK